MYFLQTPNLPKKGTLALIDGRCNSKYLNALKDLGLELILIEPEKSLYEAVSAHPDMIFHDLGGGYIIHAPEADKCAIQKLKDAGFKLIKGESRLASKYPANVGYNAARVGKFIFHNFKYTDKVLLEEIEKRGLKKIHISQGYSKCSICIVDDNSIITSDDKINKAAQENCIQSLLIPPQRNIILKGLDYGFIGGSTGKIASNKLCIYGNLEKLTDWERILSFTEERGVDIVSLGSGYVEDFGSIITIKESN